MKKGDVVYYLDGYEIPHFTSMKEAETKGLKQLDRPKVEILSIRKGKAHIRYLKNAYGTMWVDISRLSERSDIKE